ncbi:MAG TPA: type II toxin-antitoxin system VapC family toxin [Stellaceae bacterium]|nr:type II toxin-antitoxin system VapC family toxin [Stellaceae bacterium]
MSVYFDASVLIPTLIHQEATGVVQRYLGALGNEQRLISDFAASEVASALSRLVRMGALAEPEAFNRLVDFDAWRAATSIAAEVRNADMRHAYAFVRRFDLALRAPDALHLAVSHRFDAILVTLDRRLANAAGALGIAFAVPGEDNASDPR